MTRIVVKRSLVFLLLCVVMVSCEPDKDNGDNDDKLVKVTFFNNASFPVDIFYNFNPQIIDASSFLGTVDTMSRKLEVKVPASSDTLIGDTFYMRFKIPLADSFATGTTDLYVHAERTMSNISFVVESGHTYDKTIDNPPVNELRFVNGILIIQNLTNGQQWVENNGVILPQMNRETAWLTLGQFGFYELPLPYLAESWTMEFLQCRDSNSNRTSFPSFEMERGKKYFFEIKNTGISGPDVTNINPLVN